MGIERILIHRSIELAKGARDNETLFRGVTALKRSSGRFPRWKFSEFDE